MNNYTTIQTPLSACHIAVGLLAGLAGSGVLYAAEREQQELNPAPYEANSNLPSFDQLSSVFAGNSIDSIDQQLITAVSNLYATLAQESEPLGEEFEQVLHENLWDLYEG